MKCSLGISNFLEEISSLSHSMFSSISLHWSLKKAFLSLLAILWNSAFRCLYLSFSFCFSLLFFSQLFVWPPQTAILLFCISFPLGWSWSRSPVQCHKPQSIVHQYSIVLITQSCWILQPTDCSPPGSSVCGVLQARILEWAAILCSRGSSRPRNRTSVSCIAGGFFTIRATRETP